VLARVLRVLRVLLRHARVLRVLVLGRHAGRTCTCAACAACACPCTCCVRVCVDTCCVLGSPQLLATPGHHQCVYLYVYAGHDPDHPRASATLCRRAQEHRAWNPPTRRGERERARLSTRSMNWNDPTPTPVLADIIYAGAGGHHLRQRARQELVGCIEICWSKVREGQACQVQERLLVYS